MVEAGGNGGGGRVEGLGGGGKDKSNGKQRDDHWSYIACPHFLFPLIWLSQL